MNRFSSSAFVSINLSRTDLEYLIKILIFNSPKFKKNPVKQYPPLLVIPMVRNHLDDPNLATFCYVIEHVPSN